MLHNPLYAFLLERAHEISHSLNQCKNYILIPLAPPENALFENTSNIEAHIRVDHLYFETSEKKLSEGTNAQHYKANLSQAHYTEYHTVGSETFVLHNYFNRALESIKISQKSQEHPAAIIELKPEQEAAFRKNSEQAINTLKKLYKKMDRVVFGLQTEINPAIEALPDLLVQNNHQNLAKAARLLNEIIPHQAQIDRFQNGSLSPELQFYQRILESITTDSQTPREQFGLFKYGSSQDDHKNTKILKKKRKNKQNKGDDPKITEKNLALIAEIEQQLEGIAKLLNTPSREDQSPWDYHNMHRQLLISHLQMIKNQCPYPKAVHQKAESALSQYKKPTLHVRELFARGHADKIIELMPFIEHQFPYLFMEYLLNTADAYDEKVYQLLKTVFQSPAALERWSLPLCALGLSTIHEGITLTIKQYLLLQKSDNYFLLFTKHFPDEGLIFDHINTFSILDQLSLINDKARRDTLIVNYLKNAGLTQIHEVTNYEYSKRVTEKTPENALKILDKNYSARKTQKLLSKHCKPLISKFNNPEMGPYQYNLYSILFKNDAIPDSSPGITNSFFEHYYSNSGFINSLLHLSNSLNKSNIYLRLFISHRPLVAFTTTKERMDSIFIPHYQQDESEETVIECNNDTHKLGKTNFFMGFYNLSDKQVHCSEQFLKQIMQDFDNQNFEETLSQINALENKYGTLKEYAYSYARAKILLYTLRSQKCQTLDLYSQEKYLNEMQRILLETYRKTKIENYKNLFKHFNNQYVGLMKFRNRSESLDMEPLLGKLPSTP